MLFVLSYFLAISGGLALLYHFFFKPRKGSLPLPPRCGPGMLATVSKLSTITDLSSLEFIRNVSREVTGIGRTTNGAVFRLNMPQIKPFIVTTDHKLARLVLEGNSREKIPEGEKTPFIRVFDYASTPSLLT